MLMYVRGTVLLCSFIYRYSVANTISTVVVVRPIRQNSYIIYDPPTGQHYLGVSRLKLMLVFVVIVNKAHLACESALDTV